MKPTDIARQAEMLLLFAEQNKDIASDPANLSAILKSAAEICMQVHMHNISMTLLANQLKM